MEDKKYEIDKSYQAQGQNYRIFSLVLHYTVTPTLESSLKTLTLKSSKVSAHYLVPKEQMSGQRKVYQLVEEQARAWHAGVSYWQTKTNINDTSIGIEIVNLGYKDEKDEQGRVKRHWYPFDDPEQIGIVIGLAKDIIERYKLSPTCVVGHSDIAIPYGRKEDPGPLFPWKLLADNGVGAWYDEVKVKENIQKLEHKEVDIKWVKKSLKIYGYDLEDTGILDDKTQHVLTAFQMHFRPSDYSGQADNETCAILDSLNKKYFQDEALDIFNSIVEKKEVDARPGEEYRPKPF